MAKPNAPMFLERQGYRRRRIMDAARVLPVLGFILILLPVLWTRSGGLGTAGEAIYLFILWFCLIVAAALMSRPLKQALHRELTQPHHAPPIPVPPTATQTGASDTHTPPPDPAA
ncbi:hypothetical protein [Pararhodobacter oceanensis]|uniref:hypothetical protein n=1 Tax=Pararhodobacter oceanensis TaxID=2172121 RepID=UPI003A92E34D